MSTRDPLAVAIQNAVMERGFFIDLVAANLFAATARAYIADQIEAEWDSLNGKFDGNEQRDLGTLYGLDIAEQIARGEQAGVALPHNPSPGGRR